MQCFAKPTLWPAALFTVEWGLLGAQQGCTGCLPDWAHMNCKPASLSETVGESHGFTGGAPVLARVARTMRSLSRPPRSSLVWPDRRSVVKRNFHSGSTAPDQAPVHHVSACVA